MNKLTRRRLLAQASASAAAMGAATIAPALAAGGASSLPQRLPVNAPAEPVLAYVHDPAAGNVLFVIGAHEFSRHDPDLVARLIKALG